MSGCELASQSNGETARKAMGAHRGPSSATGLQRADKLRYSSLSHSLLVFSAYIETRERERERVESRVNTQNHNEELLKDPSRLVLCITKHTETHTHSAVLMCV